MKFSPWLNKNLVFGMIGLIQWVSFPNKNELVWCGFTPLFGGQEGNTKVSTEQLPLGVFNLV